MPNILIIEDNQKLSELIAQFLKRKEMDSLIVSDGISAVRSFVGASYDLLLIDIELPMMNGDAVCRAIRDSAKGRNIPIVMMSMSEKDPSEIERLTRELTLNGFLIKPFSSDTLYEVILSALQARTPEPAAPAPSPLPQPMQATLDTTPFEKVLFYLLKKKGTGVLTVAREPLQRKFFFIDGALIDLELSAEDAGFGAFLAHKDLIDGEEQKAYEDRRKSEALDPKGLFIKMGCLTPRAFQEEHTQFMHDRLVECFSWRTGTILFEWGASCVTRLPAAAAFMPALFYQGFLAHLDQASMRSFVAQKGKLYAARTAEFFEHQNHLAAELASPELLDLIDGTRTCSGIAAAIDTDDAAVALYTLDYLKMLSYGKAPVQATVQPPFPVRKREPHHTEAPAEIFEDLGGALSELAEEVGALGEVKGTPAATEGPTALEEDLNKQWEAIKGKNFYEMFGMTPKTFSFEKLKKAYFELTRTYGPEKFFGSSGQVMELAEELLSKASHAYETLSNVMSKENYDELLSRQEQVPTEEEDKEFYEKVQFQSGKVLLEQGQCESAEKAFTNCLNIGPDKAEYHAYLALAIYNNPVNKGNPLAVKRAKDAVNRSLQLGKLAISYALKGTMYLDEGSVNFAEAEFQKALKLNPNNKTALKQTDAIRQKREEEKKGFFQKLFT
jgi:CheY-like chemotaxis protein/tetratricopeptide (TPR) repeat protein